MDKYNEQLVEAGVMECGERFEMHDLAKDETFEFIEVFYDRQRRHSAIGIVSPAEFERLFTKRPAA